MQSFTFGVIIDSYQQMKRFTHWLLHF